MFRVLLTMVCILSFIPSAIAEETYLQKLAAFMFTYEAADIYRTKCDNLGIDGKKKDEFLTGRKLILAAILHEHLQNHPDMTKEEIFGIIMKKRGTLVKQIAARFDEEGCKGELAVQAEKALGELSLLSPAQTKAYIAKLK